MKSKIMKQYEGHGMISSNQPSFPKGRLCPTNLGEFFERASKILYKGESVKLIYLDFQRPLISFFTRGD